MQKHERDIDQRAQRATVENMRADGPAREHGLADRLAAAGRQWRRPRGGSCRRFWGSWE